MPGFDLCKHVAICKHAVASEHIVGEAERAQPTDEIALARAAHRLGQAKRYQEDLMTEAQRLLRVAQGQPPRSLRPSRGLARKYHESLMEHTAETGLKSLMEKHDSAVRRYDKLLTVCRGSVCFTVVCGPIS